MASNKSRLVVHDICIDPGKDVWKEVECPKTCDVATFLKELSRQCGVAVRGKTISKMSFDDEEVMVNTIP